MYKLSTDEIIEYIQDCKIASMENDIKGNDIKYYYDGRVDGILDVLHGYDVHKEVTDAVFNKRWVRDDIYNGCNVHEIASIYVDSLTNQQKAQIYNHIKRNKPSKLEG